MSYELAKQSGASVTYGWRIASVVPDGPSGGVLNVGDIIVALGNQTVKNNDDLASYLEEYTMPGDTLNMTVVRSGQEVSLTVNLGTRPVPN
jgi:S1-C subfamily serine protease